jgi:hypothetical protein
MPNQHRSSAPYERPYQHATVADVQVNVLKAGAAEPINRRSQSAPDLSAPTEASPNAIDVAEIESECSRASRGT